MKNFIKSTQKTVKNYAKLLLITVFIARGIFALPAFSQDGAKKAAEFTNSKPGFGEGGGEGAAGAKEALTLESLKAKTIDFSKNKEFLGKIKVSGKKEKTVITLKAEDKKTYTLIFTDEEVLKKALSLKNKNVKLLGLSVLCPLAIFVNDIL